MRVQSEEAASATAVGYRGHAEGDSLQRRTATAVPLSSPFTHQYFNQTVKMFIGIYGK